ncbi:carcinoembryonic antigen-related cell adhesion molecule 20-like isoform X2 [Sceloporus undulatus]|uniref:carcinoembryonic antigen-related cell adhesion molecule 20-like isoform X2 n=1 Tax=Sceloporus undulatus TaxID=8520 RepID=UPI001C4B924E|nr:carcinoembryonic antigen-related cell adhesion molecule 20-like isoform X2 [Sceloporus undulatus]
MLASGRGGTGGAAGPAPDGLLGAPQEEAPSLSRPATMPAPSLLLALALASAARFARTGPPLIRLRGPESGPVLEGSAVTLECLSSAEEAPALAFQKYGQWLQAWVSLDEGTKLIHGFYNAVVSREGGHLLLTISSVQSWHAGAYRCVSSNATSNASSADLDLQIEYLRDIFLSRAKSWCGTVGDSVTVLEGDDLQLHCFAKASRGPLYEWSREGEDWIVASSSLALTKVNLEQAGTYTCRARHPSVAQLAKTKSLRLFVEGSQRGVALGSALSLSNSTLALTVGLPALLLLVLIAVFALLILRLRRGAAKKKAAQEDPGQHTPIYKCSLGSVPSVSRDTHPLMM